MLVVKNLPANAGDVRYAGLIPGLGRTPGAGHGNTLQYSCLENPMDRGTWQAAATAAAKSLQLCLTLCDPIDGSPPGSPVPGILQARTLKWVAISFSNAWKWKLKVKSFSRIWLLATPWTAAYQAPPSMGFSRQEYWSGVPLPSPVVFPTFFNLSLNFAIRISWLEPQSAPGLVFTDYIEFLHLWLQRI